MKIRREITPALVIIAAFATGGFASAQESKPSAAPSLKQASGAVSKPVTMDAKIKGDAALTEQAAPLTAEKAKFENLRKDWQPMPGYGEWIIVSDTEVMQTVDDTAKGRAGNTGFNRAIEQSGVMTYEWSVKPESLAKGCGFFVMSTDGDKDERGSGYLLWLMKTTFTVYKITDNQAPVEKAKFPVKAIEKEFNELKARYDANKGEWTLWCGVKEAGSWIDKEPYKKGGFVSFTTCLTKANFKNVRITKTE